MSRGMDETIGTNESQVRSDPLQESWFYVFLRTRDEESGKGSSLDRDVELAFRRFSEAYGGQTHVQYDSPASGNFHRNRLRFRLQQLPAVAVAEEDVHIKEESPEQQNIAQKLWGWIRGKKSAYPTLDRDALAWLVEKGDTTALEDFLSDVHLKLVDEGIAGVDRAFLVTRIRRHAGAAGHLVKEAVRVVK